jgi:hypothetical protein
VDEQGALVVVDGKEPLTVAVDGKEPLTVAVDGKEPLTVAVDGKEPLTVAVDGKEPLTVAVEEKEQLTVAESLLARNLAWVAAADSKTQPIFAIDLAMLTLLFALLPKWTQMHWFTQFVCMLDSAALVTSVACLAAAVFPRLNLGAMGGVVYFDQAIRLTESNFIRYVTTGISKPLIEDVARHAYINAKIASVKFRWLRRAQLGAFGAAVPWLYLVISLYVHRQ